MDEGGLVSLEVPGCELQELEVVRVVRLHAFWSLDVGCLIPRAVGSTKKRSDVDRSFISVVSCPIDLAS